MATKTFEELKQMAIQIRDEKANKQNTAIRIGTQMLEHLNKLEQEYYNKENIDEQKKQTDVKFSELSNTSGNIILGNMFIDNAEVVGDGDTIEYTTKNGYYTTDGTFVENSSFATRIFNIESGFFYKLTCNIIGSGTTANLAFLNNEDLCIAAFRQTVNSRLIKFTGAPKIAISGISSSIDKNVSLLKYAEIQTEKIADSSITEDKIADYAVTESKIADSSITESKITFANSKNKFNYNDSNIMLGYYQANSSPQQSASFNLTGYIPVKAGSNYVSSGNGQLVSPRFITFFKKDFSIYSYIDSTSGATDKIQIPEGVAYARNSVAVASWENYQFEEGEVPTPYEPYKVVINKDVLPNTVTDSELSDSSENPVQNKVINRKFSELESNITENSETISNIVVVTTGNYNKLNPDDENYLIGKRISQSTGLPVDRADYNSCGFIAVNEGETYIGSATLQDNIDGSRIITNNYWYGYNNNKEIISSAYQAISTKPYIVPSGVSYIRAAHPNEEGKHYYPMITLQDSDWQKYIAFSKEKGYEIVNMPKRVGDLENDLNFRSLVIQSINLPKTIYTYKGRAIEIYFHNITSYFDDDIYIRIISSNKGKLTKEKWSYTPQASETFTLKIEIYNHDYVLLNNNSYEVVVKESAVLDKTVLVIGDSLINAGWITYYMLQFAKEDGVTLNLLGTRPSNADVPEDVDNKHEGRGGWTTDMYRHTSASSSGVANAFFNPALQDFDFSYYMQQQSYTNVDMVFFELGTNDLFSKKTDEEALQQINSCIEDFRYFITNIHQYNSKIKVVINMIIPCPQIWTVSSDSDNHSYDLVANWRVRRNYYLLNKLLLSSDLFNNENVFINYTNACIDIKNNMNGDVHPKSDGYNQIANQMYAYMRCIFVE